MRKILILFIVLLGAGGLSAQTPLDEAVDFHVKDLESNVIQLFSLLDDENKIVVIDFFTTS